MKVMPFESRERRLYSAMNSGYPISMTRWLFVIFALLIAPAPALAQEDEVTFATGTLSIITRDGTEHPFTVEIAETPEQRSRGLMFRSSLEPDHGMLFDFGRVRRVEMWMRNTMIPLDMLFIEADGTVVTIAERTVPYSLDTIPSRRRVLAVLELAGGSVDRLGIRTGDRVVHPLFGG